MGPSAIHGTGHFYFAQTGHSHFAATHRKICVDNVARSRQDAWRAGFCLPLNYSIHLSACRNTEV
jgi:hypothetical protein